jgi:hypothetical protein
VLRSIVMILAAIFICGVAVAPALAERKIAFVVGIDKYDNLGPQQQLQRADRNTAARQSFLVAATPAPHRRHYLSPRHVCCRARPGVVGLISPRRPCFSDRAAQMCFIRTMPPSRAFPIHETSDPHRGVLARPRIGGTCSSRANVHSRRKASVDGDRSGL